MGKALIASKLGVVVNSDGLWILPFASISWLHRVHRRLLLGTFRASQSQELAAARPTVRYLLHLILQVSTTWVMVQSLSLSTFDTRWYLYGVLLDSLCRVSALQRAPSSTRPGPWSWNNFKLRH